MEDCVGDQVDVYAGVYDNVGVGRRRGLGRPAVTRSSACSYGNRFQERGHET